MEGFSRFGLVFCALLLAACGGDSAPVSPETGTPEPGNPETGSEPVATLLTEGEIGPYDSFKVQFDRDIDPAGIDGIVLRQPGTGETVPLAAEYSAADRVVTFTPRRSLNEKQSQDSLNFALDISSVKAAETLQEGAAAETEKAGAQFLPPIIRVRSVVWKEYIGRDTETGEISYYWHASNHEEGEVKRVVKLFTHPGLDGDWFDIADNECSGMSVTERLAGNAYRRVRYDGPGDNERWDGGKDDEIDGITLYLPSGLPGKESSIESYGVGEDGEWFTDDDAYNVVHLWKFDPATRVLLYAYGHGSKASPGEDGEWLTGDDVLEHYIKYFYDQHLRVQRIERYRKGVNDDGAWFSDDDLLYGYSEFDYDEMGRREETRSFYLPSEGADFLPETYTRYKYDGDSRDYAYLVSHDPESDEISWYLRHDRTADGTLLRYGLFHDSGDDAKWFTDDDPSGDFSEFEMDERGFPALRWNYDGYGPDRLWFTGNESVNSLTHFEYDDKGRLLRSDYYVEPGGEDDTWNTPFDVLSFTTTYHVPPHDTDQ